mmetsp:Transcript_52815/g.153657  ORF Transcript_52815/g.153657 Transcript_52815/m.153657 type:complete len:471 (+) Transcript_52815:1373-2785(+)
MELPDRLAIFGAQAVEVRRTVRAEVRVAPHDEGVPLAGRGPGVPGVAHAVPLPPVECQRLDIEGVCKSCSVNNVAGLAQQHRRGSQGARVNAASKPSVRTNDEEVAEVGIDVHVPLRVHGRRVVEVVVRPAGLVGVEQAVLEEGSRLQQRARRLALGKALVGHVGAVLRVPEVLLPSLLQGRVQGPHHLAPLEGQGPEDGGPVQGPGDHQDAGGHHGIGLHCVQQVKARSLAAILHVAMVELALPNDVERPVAGPNRVRHRIDREVLVLVAHPAARAFPDLPLASPELLPSLGIQAHDLRSPLVACRGRLERVAFGEARRRAEAYGQDLPAAGARGKQGRHTVHFQVKLHLPRHAAGLHVERARGPLAAGRSVPELLARAVHGCKGETVMAHADSPEGARDPLCSGLPPLFAIFHSHAADVGLAVHEQQRVLGEARREVLAHHDEPRLVLPEPPPVLHAQPVHHVHHDGS